jgi:acetyl esterase/lipase
MIATMPPNGSVHPLPELPNEQANEQTYITDHTPPQAAHNASKLGADPSKGFLLSGTSAGGNLAAVVSHLWRDNGDSPKVTGCHLMIPALLDRDYVPEDLQAECQSSRELTNASILSAKAFALFVDAYIPQEQRGDPLFSPLLWPGGHKDLPPQYLQICGADPLRDEALIYERILREQCGVKTKVDLYVGMPHGFWAVFPRMEAGKRFMKDSIEGVRWLLEQK